LKERLPVGTIIVQTGSWFDGKPSRDLYAGRDLMIVGGGDGHVLFILAQQHTPVEAGQRVLHLPEDDGLELTDSGFVLTEQFGGHVSRAEYTIKTAAKQESAPPPENVTRPKRRR